MSKILLAYAFLLFGMVFFGTGTPTAKIVTHGAGEKSSRSKFSP